MSNDITQHALFQMDDQRPLPVIVAEMHKFPLQRHTTIQDDLVYAVQDWVAGLSGETDPTKVSEVWRKFKKQTRNSVTTLKMPYRARDGKTYQRDFVADETLYSFAAYTRATKDRPQIAKIKNFLAEAGVLMDMIRQDKEGAQAAIQTQRIKQALEGGKTTEWINTRELGVITRRQFTEAIQRANPEMHIGEATNEIYTGTLGANAAGLRKQLKIGERQNPRDHMSEIALIYVMASEAAVRAQLMGYGEDDIIPIPLMQAVIKTIAKATGKQAQETALLIGIDLVTGQSLLPR